MKEHSKWLGEFLVNIRNKYHLSQFELAKILKVSQAQICKWERSIHHPNNLRYNDILNKITEYEKSIGMAR